MDVQRWSSLQETFDHLVDMAPEDQAHALRELSATDPAMAEEVQGLLEEDASGQQLPEMNIESLLQAALHNGGAPWPDEGQIGPYRILRLLGEGGMGVVYLAERTDIAGFVAIKLLRDAWLSPLRRERFGIEQQMLGLLKHPSVARIYDAGTTKDGTPWFVMEFSDGVPINEYLAARNATGREVARLVRAICDTVRYAHSLAIIHRDLKPSNILVAEDGQIKLLDFGIAKQMDIVNRGSTVTTAGFRLFTPAYAAPELQNENKVGVFTDVYSMGVILYQLVTGALPFPEGGTSDRLLQRPSKLGTSVDPDNRLALSANEWADIDAICMKSLDKEAENRYGSMDAMIADIDAFVEDRPLAARKNAVIYTTRKFLYRNQLPVLSTALALLLIIIGTVLFTVRLARARDAAARARDQAVAEAVRSERVQHFTESLFTGGESYGYPPPGIKVAEMLDRGRAEASQITGDPRLQAAMFQSLGTSYAALGRPADAEPLLQRAQQVVCRDKDSTQCADIESQLGTVLGEHDSGKEAMALLRDAIRIKLEKLPANDLSTADAYVEAGWFSRVAGETDAQAKDLFRRGLVLAESHRGPSRELAFALGSYAEFGLPYNDPRALEYAERGLQMNKDLFGDRSFEYARGESLLAAVFENYGKYGEAEQHFRLALDGVKAWTGGDEPLSARYMNVLAFVLILEGKFSDAKAMLLQAIAIDSSRGNPSTIRLADESFQLGYIELLNNDFKTATERFKTVVDLENRHLSVGEQDLELSELGLATIDGKRGNYTRAEASIRQVLATTKLKASYVTIAGLSLLGDVLLHEGKPAEAERELRPAYAWFSHDTAMRPHTVMTYVDLAEAEKRLGRPVEAAKILAELRVHPK